MDALIAVIRSQSKHRFGKPERLCVEADRVRDQRRQTPAEPLYARLTVNQIADNDAAHSHTQAVQRNAPAPIAAPEVTSEPSGKGDEQLASQLIVRGVGVGTARLDRDRNYRRILVGDIVDTAAELEVLQRMPAECQVDVVV